MSNETVSLLPCKKCGADEGQAYANGGMYGVECQNCGYVVGPKAFEQDARECWNNRPVRSKPVAGVEVRPLEWETSKVTGDVAVHSVVVGGVLCRWWGDTPPEGVSILDHALSARENSPAHGKAWEFDRYINGVLMAEGVSVKQAVTLEHAFSRAAAMASKGKNGQVPVLALRSKPYASPQPEAVITEEMAERAYEAFVAACEWSDWDEPEVRGYLRTALTAALKEA